MDEHVRIDHLAGVEEVAYALGVGKAAVSMWQRRHADMPEPLRMLGCGPIWDITEVTAWYRAWKGLGEDWQPRR